MASPSRSAWGTSYAIRYPTYKRSKKTVRVWLEDDSPTEVGFTVAGCLSIFPDCKRTTGGNMWPWFCKSCQNEHRQPTRDQGRALKRRIKALRRGDGATVYESTFHIVDGEGRR
jgi:hypothetical protein